MENQERVEYLQPHIVERSMTGEKPIIIAVVLALIIVFTFATTLIMIDLPIFAIVALLGIFVLLYAIALIFLFEPFKIREINHTIVRTVEKPVVEKVFVDRPVIREVVVEKPVYRDVVRNVYVSHKSSVKIPKYNYLGSLQTKRYHARSCRLGKLIKRKYKISNNSKSFFVKKKFKACKICIKKK